MTWPRATTAWDGAAVPPVYCPYLGLADDPDSHFAFPSGAQRCHATARPSTIEVAKQARDCLTAQHISCSRYHAPTTVAARGQLLERVSGERVAVVALAEPRVTAARLRRPSRVVVERVALVVLLGIVLVGGLALGSRIAGQLNGPDPGPEATVAGGAAAPVTATPVTAAPVTAPPSPSPSPTASPTGSASRTPVASPTPTPRPTPLVHVVQRGETLTSIARRYHVTVADLAAINRIKDPNLIVVGQRLTIPGR